MGDAQFILEKNIARAQQPKRLLEEFDSLEASRHLGLEVGQGFRCLLGPLGLRLAGWLLL